MLCEVSVWRTIEAVSFEDAMEQINSIVTVTSTDTGADYEIVHDVDVKSMSIYLES
jgi:hypothetical protein